MRASIFVLNCKVNMRTTSKSQNRAKHEALHTWIHFPRTILLRNRIWNFEFQSYVHICIRYLKSCVLLKSDKACNYVISSSEKVRCSNVCERAYCHMQSTSEKSTWVPMFLYPHFRLSARVICRKYIACLSLPLPK